jgi:voltage-gated potassium channel
MIKKWAINCISDELHHPVISRIYRIYLATVVMANVVFAVMDNYFQTGESAKSLICTIQPLLFFLLFLDFILRIIGSSRHLDMESYDETLHYNTLNGYLFSYYGFIDLIGSIPFILWILPMENRDLQTLFAMASLLKIARFSPALIILKDVIIYERKPLLAALYLMMILTFSLSTLLYFVERDANPEGFGSLFDAVWWAVVTLSTVGYGDIVPQTALGKIIGSVAAITGFGMFALPAGILASGFTEEIRRLKDMANWQMVVKVPIFSDLDFGAVADISKLLHIRRFRKHEVIFREGTEGDAMYFILEGTILIRKKDQNIYLKEGDFFGEISLIKKIPRTATVISKTRSELLELTRYDFQNFIRRQPALLKKIEEKAFIRHMEPHDGA